MHVQRHHRAERINELSIRRELKLLFTGQLEIGPFADYFAEPSFFYAQGYPDHPGQWGEFAGRLLDAAGVPLSEGADDFDPSSWEVEETTARCPDCGGPLHLVDVEHRPSWRGLMLPLNVPASLAAPTTLPPTCRSG